MTFCAISLKRYIFLGCL